MTLGIVEDSTGTCHPAILIPREKDDFNGWQWDGTTYSLSSTGTTFDLRIYDDVPLVGGEEYVLLLKRGGSIDVDSNQYKLSHYTRSSDTWGTSSYSMSGTSADPGWSHQLDMYLTFGGMRGAGVEVHGLKVNDGSNSYSVSVQAFQTNGSSTANLYKAGRVSGLRLLSMSSGWDSPSYFQAAGGRRFLDESKSAEKWAADHSSDPVFCARDERDGSTGYMARLDLGGLLPIETWKRGGFLITSNPRNPVRGGYYSHFHSDRDIPIFNMGAMQDRVYYSDVCAEMFMSPIGEFSLGYYHKSTRTTGLDLDTQGAEVRVFTMLGWRNMSSPPPSFGAGSPPLLNSFNKHNYNWFTVTYRTSGEAIQGNTSNANKSLYLWPLEVFVNGTLIGSLESSFSALTAVNTSGMSVGSRITSEAQLPSSGAIGSAEYNSEEGYRGLQIAEARLWKTGGTEAKYLGSDPSTFEHLNDEVPSNEWPDLLTYFRMHTDDKTGAGTLADPIVIDNVGVYDTSTNLTDLTCLPDCSLVSTVSGDLGSSASGSLASAPIPEIVAIEYLRSFAYGYDVTVSGDQERAEASSQGGPFFVVGSTPIGATSYTDNAPQSSLSSFVHMDSGYTPDVIKGFGIWQGFLCVWGNPDSKSTLYFAEPGPFGWESFPQFMEYKVPISEAGGITAFTTLGRNALVFGKDFTTILTGDPTTPSSSTIGGGVGSFSMDTVVTYSTAAFTYNGTLWAIDAEGGVQDVGRPIQDLLPDPSNARLKVSSALASLFVIDRSTRRALRFHFPTQQWTIEDRNLRDVGDYEGRGYFIHNKGHVAKDSNVYFEDDVPSGVSGIGGGKLPASFSPLNGEVTMDGVAFNTTAPYPGYARDLGYYQDYIGMRVVSFTSTGETTSAVVDYNTSSMLHVVGGSSGWTNGVPDQGADIYLGVPEEGFGIDTGSIALGKEQGGTQSILTSVDISSKAPSGSYLMHSATSRPDDPRDASSVGDLGSSSSDAPLVLGLDPNERLGMSTRGRWHRVRFRSLSPSATKVKFLELGYRIATEEEPIG
jgi:hypothetical protein